MVSTKPLSSPWVTSFSRQNSPNSLIVSPCRSCCASSQLSVFSSPAVILLSEILISYWSITYLLPLGETFWSHGQYRKKLQLPLLEELWPKSKQVARWKAQNLFLQMYDHLLWNFVFKKDHQWFFFAFRNKNLSSGSCFVFHICSF